MCLNDPIAWDACLALQAVDVLGEELEQEPLLVQQVYERVCDCRAIFAGVQLLREGVEGQRVLSEEGQLEDGLGVGQVQALEVGVQPRLW